MRGSMDGALAVQLLVLASTCIANEPYPTQCQSVYTPFKRLFAKDMVSEETHPNGLVKLTIHLLPRVATKYVVELDTRMVFHFKALTNNERNTDDSISICAGFASLHIMRQKDLQMKEVRGEYQTNHKVLMFFDNFKEFELKARFKPDIPVSNILIDRKCWEENRSYRSCFLSLQVDEKMNTLFTLDNPFSEEFWEYARVYLHHTLGAELERLHMAFPYDHNNVLFRWLVWSLDQDHVEIYDFRMSSSDYNPNWGSLNTSLLQIMPHLTRLDLSNNGISKIQPEYLTTVTDTLTFLNLGRNKLTTIPPEIYNLTKITFLDLSRNPFKEVYSFFEPRHFKRFPNLNFFNMSSVSIGDINLIEPFLQKINLIVLDLSFCDLKDFDKHPHLVSEQRNMTHLFLAGNKMGTSPHLNFRDEQKLLTIDLTFNNLTSPLHILDTGEVTYLNISLNNITNWTNFYPEHPYSNISVFGHIDHLNLSINTIPALTLVMGESLEELKTVDLGDNPIDCSDCDVPEFKRWLEKHNNTNRTNKMTLLEFNKTRDDFLCTRPPELKMFNVSNTPFDEKMCQKQPQNLFILLGIPLAAIGSLVILLGTILYAYRYEATYLLHLVKIKRRMKATASRTEGDYKYDAFVCYSGADRAWVVGELLPTLEHGPEQYRLCLHERDFMLGTFITSNIVGAMQNSRNTIVVLTENFVRSQWCKWELEMANHKLFEESREFLVLIELERLDRSNLPRHLKYLMDTRTYLEWPDPEDRTGEVDVVYKRLKEALGPSIYEMEQEQEQEQAQDSEETTNQDMMLREKTA